MTNLYLGDRSVYVQYLQLALKRAGFNVNITGDFNEDTCQTLKEFYREKEILDDRSGCYVDTSVWNLLIPYLKGYTTHVIKQGDTIWNIANRYASSVDGILTANPQADLRNLQIGTKIYVPYNFELVSDEVDYTSTLVSFIIEGFEVRYPFISVGSVGKSVMGRDISYIRIGEGQKEIFYNAAFHANEWITTPVLLKFVEEYAFAYAMGNMLYNVNPRDLYYDYSLYVVPLVNPDGVDLVNQALNNMQYELQTRSIASRYPDIPYPSGWKANIDGIDLNLQFPAGWDEAKIIKYAQGYTSPAPRDFVGEEPLTAIESLNIFNFTLEHDFSLILAYHTQGKVIYWKYLDYEPEGSRRIADYFGLVSGYEVESTPYESGYAGYKDWFILTYNRPGYTIEVGSGVNPLPMSQFNMIYQDNIGILIGGMTEI